METDLQIQPGDRFVIQCLRRPVYRRAGLSFVGGRNEAQLLGPDSEPVDGVLDVSPDQLASLLADPNLVIKVEAAATDNAAAGLVAGGVLDGVTGQEQQPERRPRSKSDKGQKK
ncbi:hypothetical protein MKU92_004095 [Salmonella enterica]|nr:hypothetical protein [Salmonella enterica]EIX6435114.1 hypothetical protein [Salmonella enterica]EKE2594401.1 hypothetical protein [Salmonella enterica]MJP99723.1 hypothetical protein [Salmonella enterica subsp. enterica serovar Othmarschen]